MPIHDWTRVPAGLFHHFHQDWSIEIARELNRGRLPPGLSGLVEQRAGPLEPKVLAIKSAGAGHGYKPAGGGGTATAEPPATRLVRRAAKQPYASRANRRGRQASFGPDRGRYRDRFARQQGQSCRPAQFVEKTIGFLRAGIHVLIVDLFPPTPRDPFGIHKAIWDEIEEEDFTFPRGKTGSWYRIRPAASVSRTSSRWPSETSCRTWRCF